ncbi:hypothetical protein JRQ81_012214 [Phrynocephalus forsythii]|uniref:BED-type domain-containing protein n=1 Tax=Phrynocephalus forsythii TaxID=171643 RepID=A0A9Q0X5T1_9SAUR|nr:hypothetical protein JRQ81_012214 [Phrynocephalus forsythii]
MAAQPKEVHSLGPWPAFGIRQSLKAEPTDKAALELGPEKSSGITQPGNKRGFWDRKMLGLMKQEPPKGRQPWGAPWQDSVKGLGSSHPDNQNPQGTPWSSWEEAQTAVSPPERRMDATPPLGKEKLARVLPRGSREDHQRADHVWSRGKGEGEKVKEELLDENEEGEKEEEEEEEEETKELVLGVFQEGTTDVAEVERTPLNAWQRPPFMEIKQETDGERATLAGNGKEQEDSGKLGPSWRLSGRAGQNLSMWSTEGEASANPEEKGGDKFINSQGRYMAAKHRCPSPLEVPLRAEVAQGVKQEELDLVGLGPEKGPRKGPQGIPDGMPEEFWGRDPPAKWDLKEGTQETWEAQWQAFLKTMESECSSPRMPQLEGSVPGGRVKDVLPQFKGQTGIGDRPAEPLSDLASEMPHTESKQLVLDPSEKETANLAEAEEETFPDDGQPPVLREIKQEDDLADIFLGAATAAAKVMARPATIADHVQTPCLEVGREKTMEEEEEEDKEPTTSTALTQPPVPWFGFEEAVTFVRQKGKNVIVQCNYCLPLVKTLSSAISTSSNVKQHLKKAHPEKLQAILEVLGGRTRRRRHSEVPHEDEEEGCPAVKTVRTRLQKWQYDRDISFQNVLDQKLLDYVVEETVPLQTVDKPAFRALICLGLPKDLTLMSAQTLRETVARKAAAMRESLRNQLGGVSYVATTADCWSSGRRSFLAVTAHWINPATMRREWGALACQRLNGPCTYGVLARALHGVHVQYGIDDKVVGTVTDNGAHFAKALHVSKAKEPGGPAAGAGDQGQEETKVEFLPISEILDADNEEEEETGEEEEEEFFCLPPQLRCASHTLNLVATEDLRDLLPDAFKHSPWGPFKKHFRSLVGKCGKLWSRQGQSEEIAEFVRRQCGARLKVPDKTRWCSIFEALKQLQELLSTRPQNVDAIRDRCGVARMAEAELQVLEEYTEIMAPVARGLDILHHRNSTFMAYLLPTLYSLDRKLQKLEDRAEPYTYCLPLLKAAGMSMCILGAERKRKKNQNSQGIPQAKFCLFQTAVNNYDGEVG